MNLDKLLNYSPKHANAMRNLLEDCTADYFEIPAMRIGILARDNSVNIADLPNPFHGAAGDADEVKAKGMRWADALIAGFVEGHAAEARYMQGKSEPEPAKSAEPTQDEAPERRGPGPKRGVARRKSKAKRGVVSPVEDD